MGFILFCNISLYTITLDAAYGTRFPLKTVLISRKTILSKPRKHECPETSCLNSFVVYAAFFHKLTDKTFWRDKTLSSAASGNAVENNEVIKIGEMNGRLQLTTEFSQKHLIYRPKCFFVSADGNQHPCLRARPVLTTVGHTAAQQTDGTDSCFIREFLSANKKYKRLSINQLSAFKNNYF